MGNKWEMECACDKQECEACHPLDCECRKCEDERADIEEMQRDTTNDYQRN